MKRSVVFAVLWFAVLAIAAGCGSETVGLESPTPPQESTTTTNSPLTIFGPLGFTRALSSLERMIGLNALPYDIRVVDGLSLDGGLQGLLNGTIDTMILTRIPLEDEGIVFFEVARSPLAILVNPDTGIDNLSRTELEMVFAGEITNWSEVGGTDLAINVLILPESTPITQAMRGQIMGEQPFSEAADYLPTGTDIEDIVTGLPGTIGYDLWAGKAFLNSTRPVSNELTAISLDGLTPDDPDYPFQTPIGWAFLPERQEFLQPLLDLNTEVACSGIGQALARQFSVIPICPRLPATPEGQ